MRIGKNLVDGVLVSNFKENSQLHPMESLELVMDHIRVNESQKGMWHRLFFPPVERAFRWVKFFLLVVVYSIFQPLNFAFAKGPQYALVRADVTPLLKSPSESGELIVYLRAKEFVRVEGPVRAGWAKILTKAGKRGFVQVSGLRWLDKRSLREELKNKRLRDSEDGENEEFEREEASRFAMGRWMGIGYSRILYPEVLGPRVFVEPQNGLQIKLSGSQVFDRVKTPLASGSLVDINLRLQTAPPSVYSESLRGSAEGFLLHLSPRWMIPFLDKPDQMVYFSMGPLFVLDLYTVRLPGFREVQAASLRLGADFAIGIGRRVGPLGVRLEANYLFERKSYMGFGLYLEREY